MAIEDDREPAAAPPARLARSPVSASLAAVGVLAAVYLASALASGGMGQLFDSSTVSGLHVGVWFNAVLALTFGVTLWANLAERSRALCDFDALAGSVAPARFEELRRELVGSLGVGWVGVATGAVCGAALHYIGDAAATARGAADWVPLHGHANLLALALLFAMMGWRAQATLGASRVFAAVGRARTEVPLLSPGALAPYARCGLRLAFYWFLGSAIASLLFGDRSSAALVAGVLCVTLALGVASLVLPCRGIHERLRDAKAGELARVRAALDRLRPAALEEGGDALRLGALLAYEARLEDVREWPFDTSTLGRFTLVLLIPLGSWLGGALVERVVDAILS